MKKQNMLMAALPVLLIGALLISGCQTIFVTKNGEAATGETESRQYDFRDFARVEIGSAFSYEIIQSASYSINITAGNNMFDDIRVAREGQTLVIGTEFPEAPWAIRINTPGSVKAVITMPQLQGLDSSGATHGTVTGFSSPGGLDVSVSGASRVALVRLAAGDVRADVSGASKLTGDIAAQDMEIALSGASTIELQGSAGDIAADVSGASHLKLEGLRAGNAGVSLSGASKGTVNPAGRLDAELSGASTLEYAGEPYLGTMDITGSSKLARK